MTLDDPSAALDAWAAATFAGPEGAALLEPWLARWRDEIGEVHGDYAEVEAWSMARTDWALVDMGAGAATVARDPQWRRVADSWVGLFEVWPTEGGGDRPRAWLRDRIGGICLALDGAIDLRREPEGPAALWELRGVVREGRFVPCRPPIAYPRELAWPWPAPRRGTGPLPDPMRPQRLLAALRRARLRHARTPRMDPRPIFEAAIHSVETIGGGAPGSAATH